MIENVDLRRLQVLRMVSECGTVTAAATALHLTPSAVSHQIRQLSREVDMPLLEHAGRRVRLTPGAEKLVGHADALQERWERARADLADSATGRLRLAGVPTAVAGLLAPAAAMLADRSPQLDVRIDEIESVDASGLLLSGDADIAVVVPTMDTPAPTSRQFHQEPLLTEPLDLLVPPRHPLAGRSAVTLLDVADERWILATPGRCDFYDLVTAACTSAGFKPDVAHHASDPHVASALVGHGLGVTLAPRLGASRSPGPAVRLSLGGTPRPSRRIVAYVRSGSQGHPAVRSGFEVLREVAETAV